MGNRADGFRHISAVLLRGGLLIGDGIIPLLAQTTSASLARLIILLFGQLDSDCENLLGHQKMDFRTLRKLHCRSSLFFTAYLLKSAFYAGGKKLDKWILSGHNSLVN
jgi:hypothetical protein